MSSYGCDDIRRNRRHHDLFNHRAQRHACNCVLPLCGNPPARNGGKKRASDDADGAAAGANDDIQYPCLAHVA